MTNKVSILLIDDNRIDTIYTSKVLEREVNHKELHIFYQAQDAIDFLSENVTHSPSEFIVIVDLHMPEMGGLEFIETISEELKNIKTQNIIQYIIISGSDFPNEVVEFKKSSELPIQLLRKPLDVSKLKALLIQ
ncbi:MAG: response regulator [Cyclobacteriaceae bacterium]|nr:response regulator [Cyclobacteriaceae bacterium]MCH8515998.1 response regulator [Cyclobacteriaceae bacterium]